MSVAVHLPSRPMRPGINAAARALDEAAPVELEVVLPCNDGGSVRVVGSNPTMRAPAPRRAVRIRVPAVSLDGCELARARHC